MIASASVLKALPRLSAAVAVCMLGASLSGCADMSDGMTQAFADPAKYELYDCKQLESERKNLASRAAELQGLMAKAETGVAGSVVAELAYRNDYVAVRGQSRFAEEAWRKNKCREGMPSSTQPPPTRPDFKPAPHSKSGSAVY
jgi:hypothetical protein